MIGIYRIKNISNSKCYYGSSKNIEKRWRDHKRTLINHSHINNLLQRAWDKYGENNFIFEIIEECQQDLLFEVENKYLMLNPEYNIGMSANGGDNLTNHPDRDNIINKITKSIRDRYRTMTDEEKKEKHSKPMESNPNWKGGISIRNCECGKKIGCDHNHCNKCRPRSKENNPFFGKKHSKKTKKILSEKRKGIKPSNMRKTIINGIQYDSLTEASKQTGISKPTILWRINSKNIKFMNYRYSK